MGGIRSIAGGDARRSMPTAPKISNWPSISEGGKQVGRRPAPGFPALHRMSVLPTFSDTEWTENLSSTWMAVRAKSVLFLRPYRLQESKTVDKQSMCCLIETTRRPVTVTIR